MAPKKTRMVSLNKGFHFLGIQFDVARTTPYALNHEKRNGSVKVSLHPRSNVIPRLDRGIYLPQIIRRTCKDTVIDGPTGGKGSMHICAVREPKWSDGDTCGRMFGTPPNRSSQPQHNAKCSSHLGKCKFEEQYNNPPRK